MTNKKNNYDPQYRKLRLALISALDKTTEPTKPYFKMRYERHPPDIWCRWSQEPPPTPKNTVGPECFLTLELFTKVNADAGRIRTQLVDDSLKTFDKIHRDYSNKLRDLSEIRMPALDNSLSGVWVPGAPLTRWLTAFFRDRPTIQTSQYARFVFQYEELERLFGEAYVKELGAESKALKNGYIRIRDIARFHWDNKHLVRQFDANQNWANGDGQPTLAKLLHRSKNLILEGVPGTGKTFAIQDIVKNWEKHGQPVAGNGRGKYAITFHPSTAYEDFVEGLRPVVGGQQASSASEGESQEQGPDTRKFFFVPVRGPEGATFAIRDGFFLQICAKAYHDPDHDYIVLLDELNRANIPKTMGDLLTTIEASKRIKAADRSNIAKVQTLTLPYSQREFFVPDNVYVLGTRNTTDRSVAPMDAALRRRFAFHRLEPMGFENATEQPNHHHLAQALKKEKRLEGEALDASLKAWVALNRTLKSKIGPDAMLGHSYFFDLDSSTLEDDLPWIWQYQLLPQLIDTIQSLNAEDAVDTLNSILKSQGWQLQFVGENLSRQLVAEKLMPSQADQDTPDSAMAPDPEQKDSNPEPVNEGEN